MLAPSVVSLSNEDHGTSFSSFVAGFAKLVQGLLGGAHGWAKLVGHQLHFRQLIQARAYEGSLSSCFRDCHCLSGRTHCLLCTSHGHLRAILQDQRAVHLHSQKHHLNDDRLVSRLLGKLDRLVGCPHGFYKTFKCLEDIRQCLTGLRFHQPVPDVFPSTPHLLRLLHRSLHILSLANDLRLGHQRLCLSSWILNLAANVISLVCQCKCLVQVVVVAEAACSCQQARGLSATISQLLEDGSLLVGCLRCSVEVLLLDLHLHHARQC
mmetsp:Transcript_43331/g.68701  ORF Transcript_43331/g.68701 Transcript_43331/m.68701 type:complete len:266 (+) Transcript_43331:563-1360(+)